jgi:hypothetical protein
MWRAILTEIFPQSDKSWTWRRRMAFIGCGVFLWAIVYSVAWIKSETMALAVLAQCIAGFLATMGIYFGGAHADAKLASQAQTALLLATPEQKGS